MWPVSGQTVQTAARRPPAQNMWNYEGHYFGLFGDFEAKAEPRVLWTPPYLPVLLPPFPSDPPHHPLGPPGGVHLPKYVRYGYVQALA